VLELSPLDEPVPFCVQFGSRGPALSEHGIVELDDDPASARRLVPLLLESLDDDEVEPVL
jgi:hypothetical protein